MKKILCSLFIVIILFSSLFTINVYADDDPIDGDPINETESEQEVIQNEGENKEDPPVLLSSPNQNNENDNNNQPQQISDVKILFNGKTINLSSSGNDEYLMWFCDWDNTSQEVINDLYNALNQQGDFDYTIQYKVGGSPQEINTKKSETSYGNYMGVHGYYQEYNENGKRGLICVGPTDCSTEFAQVKSATFTNGDVTAAFVKNDQASTDRIQVYELDGDYDSSFLKNENGQLKIKYVNGTSETNEFNYGSLWNFNYGDQIVIGANIFYSVNNDPNYMFLFVGKYVNQQDEIKKNSFIDVYGEYQYRINRFPDGTYEWIFYVDPITAYNERSTQGSFFLDVRFKNNGIFSTVTFDQIVQDEYTYRVPQTPEEDGDEELVKLTLKGENDSNFKIKGSEGGKNGEQIHIFQVTVDSNEVLKHSFVSGINNGRVSRVLDYKTYQYLNLSDSIFLTLKTDMFVSENTSSLIDAIRNIGSGTDHSSLNLEADYFSLALVEGASIKSKTYSISETGTNVNPVITYTITKGGVDETFEVRIITSGSQKEVVMIEDDVYLKTKITVGGNEYTIYVSEFADQSLETLLGYLDYRYPVIVFDGQMEHYNKELTYIDGLYVRKEYTRNLKVYYPKEGVEINNDTKYSDLNVVDELNKSIVISSNDGSGSYNNTKERLNNDIKRIPVGYIDADGVSHYVKEDYRFYDYSQFESYNGNEVAYYAGLKQLDDGSYTIIEQIKTNRLITIVKYHNYYPNDTRREDNVKVLNVSEVEGETSSEKLEKALEILQSSYNPVLNIDVEEFTLDRSVILNRFMLGDELNRNLFLTIDLKGHTLDLGNNKLEIPENCGVQFINSSETKKGKVTGSGEFLIKNYGRLNISNNIEFINNSGTALVCANDSFGMIIGEGVSIKAVTGIKWVERTCKYFKQMQNVQLTINGIIEATNRCIDVDLPSEHEGLTYSIRFLHGSTTVLKTGTSGVGIFVNGDIVCHLNKMEITAGIPFEVNGGTYNFDEINAKSTAGSIFLVHSESSNAKPVRINFNVEGFGEDYFVDSIKSLVEDTASTSQSKISKVSFLSAQGISGYFTYKANEIFKNVPQDAIDMNSGFYSDNSFTAYLANANIRDYTYKEEYIVNEARWIHTDPNHQNINYVELIRPTSETWVYNYNDLKNALIDTNISIINVAQGFNCDGEQPIEFTVPKGKVLRMHEHEIQNISLIANVDEILEEQPTSGEFRIIGGTIRNNNHKTPITIKGAKLRLHDDVSIISEDTNAIVLENGDITTEGDESSCTVIGKNAISVNVDTSKTGFYANVSLRNSHIIGLNNPALVIDSSDTESDKFIHVHVENSKITTQTSINNTTVSDDANTIVMCTPASISIKDSSEITSGKTAIKLVENNNNGTYSVQISSSKVEGVNGVHLIPGSHLTIEGIETHIDVSNNAIEAYELSSIHMEDGYVSGKNIVVFLDQETEFRRQSIRGGYFSKEVDSRAIQWNDTDDFKYVCLQVDDLSVAYPYVVLKQFTNVNVYQSVSLSIKREVEVNQNQLEHAISDAERAALEEEAAREGLKEVDIVLTVRPETSNNNDHDVPNLRNKEYYDIHMNKNVGKNKKRVEEVSEYQLITISLAGLVGEENVHTYDPGKINVWHRHSNGAAKMMKKVSTENGLYMQEHGFQEECFYITQDQQTHDYYVNIVTKRFSLFVLGEDPESNVETQPLKENVELTLDYKDLYVVGETITDPTEATISEGRTISKDAVDVVYEGVGDTIYYSPTASNPVLTPPTEPGKYKVIWTIKEENETLSGSGSKEFTISDGHVHNFEYKASEDTLTATCQNNNCNIPNGKVSIKLVAPTIGVYGGTGTVDAGINGLEDFNSATGLTVSENEITYAGTGTTVYDESTTAPTSAGTFAASITVKGATASAGYTIAQRSVEFTWPEISSYEYNGNEQSVTATPNTLGSDALSLTYVDNAKIEVGEYTAKVTGISGNDNYVLDPNEETASFSWSIVKATKTAPTGMTVTKVSDTGVSDGAISNIPTDAAIEYAYSAQAVDDPSSLNWQVVSGDKLENLSAGTYYIRYKGDEHTNTSEIAVIAIGSVSQLKVTFVVDGANYDQKVVDPDTTVSAPSTDPAKKDMDFAGWYYNDTKFDFSTKITEDITLLAQWIEKAKDEEINGTSVRVAGSELEGKTVNNKYSDKPLVILLSNGVIVIPANLDKDMVVPELSGKSNNLASYNAALGLTFEITDRMYGIYLSVNIADINEAISNENQKHGYMEINNSGFVAEFMTIDDKHFDYPGSVTIILNLEAFGIVIPDERSGYVRSLFAAHNFKGALIEYLPLTLSADGKTASYTTSNLSPFALVYKETKRSSPSSSDYVAPRTGN